MQITVSLSAFPYSPPDSMNFDKPSNVLSPLYSTTWKIETNSELGRIRKFGQAEHLNAVFAETPANNRERMLYLGLIFRVEGDGREAWDFRVLQLVGGGVDFRDHYVFAFLEFLSQLCENRGTRNWLENYDQVNG